MFIRSNQMRTDIYPHKKIRGKQDRKQTVLKKIPPFFDANGEEEQAEAPDLYP